LVRAERSRFFVSLTFFLRQAPWQLPVVNFFIRRKNDRDSHTTFCSPFSEPKSKFRQTLLLD
ncbi:hypothetical protein, partial [Aphanothece microscopica]|uniref:hypothetical protein n=1 Tax=Aphanothece microscopica TaxID=1049561 RepID=UPI0039848E15